MYIVMVLLTHQLCNMEETARASIDGGNLSVLNCVKVKSDLRSILKEVTLLCTWIRSQKFN